MALDTETQSLIVCKNCGNQFTGKFCNQCGEKVYSANDRSFKHLFEEFFHFFTHFEGNFFNTLKAMFTKPGKVSKDFCAGIRKRYFKPISFFLLLVILYLLFPTFGGLNMKLHFHQKHELYGAYATAKIAEVKEKKHLTDNALEEVYAHKSEKTSKFLLFIIIPFMALVSVFFGKKKRQYYFDHFIFCTETISFLILLGFLLFPLVFKVMNLIGIKIFLDELQLLAVLIIAFLLYVTLSAHRFFEFKFPYAIVYSLLFTISFMLFFEFAYKFILFFITIHLV